MSALQGTEYYDGEDGPETVSLLPVVAPPSEMDDPTFIKHWNMRHEDIGKDTPSLRLYGDTTWADEIATFRAVHRRVHDGTLGHEVNHNHRDGDQPWQDGIPENTRR